jgi:hypothetical protein
MNAKLGTNDLALNTTKLFPFGDEIKKSDFTDFLRQWL